MTEAEIIASQAFRLINHEIDVCSTELVGLMMLIRGVSAEETDWQERIGTRISHEVTSRAEVTLPFPLSRLDHLATLIADAKANEKRIRELQALKCRLVGDWDFTHGDLSLQHKIFGAAS